MQAAKRGAMRLPRATFVDAPVLCFVTVTAIGGATIVFKASLLA
jgi:hypothetical protein